MINNKDWSKQNWTLTNSRVLELDYNGDNMWFREQDLREIYIKLDIKKSHNYSNGYPVDKKALTSRNISINYQIGDNEIRSHGFSHSNMKKFDINEFLDESIRYIENIVIFEILRNYEETEEHIEKNVVISHSIRTLEDLKKFNDQVDVMKEEFSYLIDAKNMGLL